MGVPRIPRDRGAIAVRFQANKHPSRKPLPKPVEHQKTQFQI